MLQSRLFGKTSKSLPKDSSSTNHALLVRAGFVHQEMAGVYSYLPLGLRVLKNIERIVREEMDRVGAQEVLMPVLHPKSLWQITGRWDAFDVLYKLHSRHGSEFAVGPTHEEVITPLVQQYVSSYKDLPLALYQIQTKFRDEARAKSGLLRGREFGMKDMYSFHASQEDLQRFYALIMEAYKRIFERLSLPFKIIEASGGDFTKKFSHEFSVLTSSGEDVIIFCEQCDFAQNREVATIQAGSPCPKCGHEVRKSKAIESANIFDLGTRFSEAFGLTYADQAGAQKPVLMGCYGFGTTRMVGTIVEHSHDDRGMIWPPSVAPFQVHLLALSRLEDVRKLVKQMAHELKKRGVSVLVDDRDVRPGEKFNDSDLIGIPVRLAVGEKSLPQIEWKERTSDTVLLMDHEEVLNKIATITTSV